jgi:hypothetical protein
LTINVKYKPLREKKIEQVANAKERSRGRRGIACMN